MSKFNNCVAVITGAGSGIGRALALQLGSAGARLAISDINAENLNDTAEELKNNGIDVLKTGLITALDVADEAAVFAYADSVQDHFGEVNLVINNAGVALSGGPLWETPIEDFKWLMGINFNGVLHGTKAFLPHLRSAPWGHIVNISSLFGLIAVPEQNAYNASKFAVRGLTEALRQELEIDKSSVSCTSVHPGGIKTNIARSARVSEGNILSDPQAKKAATDNFDKIARTTAESAAQQILLAVLKDKKRLLIGGDARVLDKIQRLFPTAYGTVMQKLMSMLGN